ncbi:hypothetical protein [Streptomyces noursei]|nr:hypothetical protein [Streptomyces noursei]
MPSIYHRRNDGRAVAALTGHLTTLGPSGQIITGTGQYPQVPG